MKNISLSYAGRAALFSARPITRWLDTLNLQRRALVSGVLALLPISIVLGIQFVPAHWTSIWSDAEFTGWVAPIANRLADGQELYADGAHSPMPPLPFVFTYWLTQGHATWFSESLLNYLCKVVTLVAIVWGFHRVLPWPAPLLTAFGLLLAFLCLAKTILYDAQAQLFVTLSAVFAVRALTDPSRTRKARLYMLLAGATGALCFMSKQSTASGVFAGTLLAVWLPRSAGTFRDRLAWSARYLAGFGAAAAALLVALAPWIDVRGFFQDIVLSSSEVKGGTPLLVKNLTIYAATVWRAFYDISVPPAVLGIGVMAWAASSQKGDALAPVARDASYPIASSVGAALGAALAVFAAVEVNLGYGDAALQALLYCSLICLIVARARSVASPPWITALSIFACVTFPAAVGHSLSVAAFRWTYDNNPLIALPLAFAASVAVATAGHQSSWSRAALVSGGLSIAVASITAGTFTAAWHRAKSATQPWPQVPYLKGARLRASATDMLRVVESVWQHAPNANDSVLLLPSDPNVEAWFQRPRPHLSSAILFADQYWDRYVDTDYRRLQTNPPRVLVIGPRIAWRPFCYGWQGEKGVVRLTDRVLSELIPKFYAKAAEFRIQAGGGDMMDVYVLRDAAKSARTP